MVAPEVAAYVQLLRNRGITTDTRLRRQLRGRFPALDERDVSEAIGHIPQPGLWNEQFGVGFLADYTSGSLARQPRPEE